MPLKEALKKRREEINNRKEINKRTEILASSCNNTVVANLIVIYLVPKKHSTIQIYPKNQIILPY
jgi:hypothetical protein